MSQCNKFKPYFSNYIEGELSSDIRKNLEKHISLCPDCDEIVSRMRQLRQSLEQLAPIAASADFDFKLNQKLRLLDGKKQSAGFPLDAFLNWKFVTASAAVVVIAFSSFMIMDGQPETVTLDSFQESSLTPSITGQEEAASGEEIPNSPDTDYATGEEDSTSLKKKHDLKDKIKYVNDK